MNPIRTIAAAAAIALFVPAVAIAAEDTTTDSDSTLELPEQASPVAKEHAKKAKKGKHGKKGKKARASFPMEGEKFMQHVQKRLDKIEARVEARLARSKMSDQAKENIRADLAESKGKITAAAKEAAADGTVTKQEAKQVRNVARAERRELRKEYGKKGKSGARKGKGRHGKGKGAERRSPRANG